ncbi:MAG: hypothetical protein GTN82_31100, partial [Candidatus Aminicenantes bacterium]|nr:hypothetical protein [Candidatus Aminicenantes bacterium]
LKRRAQEKLSTGDFEQIKDKYENLVPYILTHNFAAIELVFKAVEKENLEIFSFERTIEYLIFNFKLLYQMRETKELNARFFIDEAFAGFSGN